MIQFYSNVRHDYIGGICRHAWFRTRINEYMDSPYSLEHVTNDHGYVPLVVSKSRSILPSFVTYQRVCN